MLFSAAVNKFNLLEKKFTPSFFSLGFFKTRLNPYEAIYQHFTVTEAATDLC
jgi:hypothetical protein